jgi:hypothetical protein
MEMECAWAWDGGACASAGFHARLASRRNGLGGTTLSWPRCLKLRPATADTVVSDNSHMCHASDSGEGARIEYFGMS